MESSARNSSTVQYKSIDPESICDFISKNSEVVLLDVRTKSEFDGMTDAFGTLKNAINIPIQELERRMNEISSMKNNKIIVYCSHSHRSPIASQMLVQNGFTDVTNMSGGISTMKDSSCKKDRDQ